MRALAGRTVAFASFAQVLCGLLADSVGPLHRGITPRDVALVGLGPVWHAGGLELGTDADGELVAVRCTPVDVNAPEGSLGICQGTFEIVALRSPTPLERLELELVAERGSGQAHAFTLTRASVAAAARAGRGGASEGPAQRLERLVGELPQNVARSIEGWARGARTVALRSALFVDVGDAARANELADGPLAGLVVARLGEALLAVRGDDLPAIERALAAAGLPLEPGLDRVSGRWIERDSGNARQAESAWQPREEPPPRLPGLRPRGRQVSTIGRAPAAAPEGTPALIANLARLIDEGEPVELSLSERGRYEIAVVIPTALDGGRLLGWCEDCQQEHAFLLETIEEVALTA